jgi:mannose-6-phosphate isomerase class I
VKLLDGGQRLPVHAHPHAAFAARHLGRAHGEAEAWYIVSLSCSMVRSTSMTGDHGVCVAATQPSLRTHSEHSNSKAAVSFSAADHPCLGERGYLPRARGISAMM